MRVHTSAPNRARAAIDLNEAYLVGPILRACQVLNAFRFEGEAIPLRELVERTGLSKATAFRAAQSLIAGGLLERVGTDCYRALMIRRTDRSLRVGYASMTTKSLFSRDVSESIRLAASSTKTELIEVDNRLSARTALRNAERLVAERVDVVIEFQACQQVAPAVSAKFAEAQIPMIAIHTPHPGATFFGGNNYVAGRLGGRALGQWATANWAGEVDEVLLLGHSAAGSLTQSRLTGTAVGISEVLPNLDHASVVQLDGKGGYAETMEIVMKHLARVKATRFLVGAVNDSVALGAVRAFAEAGRNDQCAVMGQNGTLAARAAMRQKHARLVGSVGYFPEKYGDHLLPLAIELVKKKAGPPAIFVKHVLITPQNVDHLYPNDALNTPLCPDILLFGRYH